jgi:hypothetical protein
MDRSARMARVRVAKMTRRLRRIVLDGEIPQGVDGIGLVPNLHDVFQMPRVNSILKYCKGSLPVSLRLESQRLPMLGFVFSRNKHGYFIRLSKPFGAAEAVPLRLAILNP